MKLPPFQIIPAIDLLDSKLVRLFQGDYDKTTIYKQDPIQQAEIFCQIGIQLLHLVDLNAARTGYRHINYKTIKSIVRAVKGQMQVELGGGLRDMEALQTSFDTGINRCIIGTAALKNPKLLEQALHLYGPERIIVGVDARDGFVHVAGWEENSTRQVQSFLAQLEQQGVMEIIFTDITRDGTLTGPGCSLLENYIDTCSLRFILSGGVSSIKDIKQLLTKKHPRLIGAITGRAYYEGKLNIDEAVKLCRIS